MTPNSSESEDRYSQAKGAPDNWIYLLNFWTRTFNRTSAPVAGIRSDCTRTTIPCNALHTHFGQKFRLLPIWPKCDDQLGEGSTESCRRFLAGEFDLCRQDEHRLVDNRPRTGKIKIGGADVAQNVRSASDVRRFHSQSRRKFLESSSGHCGHDVG